jgi:hypothetical protein
MVIFLAHLCLVVSLAGSWLLVVERREMSTFGSRAGLPWEVDLWLSCSSSGLGCVTCCCCWGNAEGLRVRVGRVVGTQLRVKEVRILGLFVEVC